MGFLDGVDQHRSLLAMGLGGGDQALAVLVWDFSLSAVPKTRSSWAKSVGPQLHGIDPWRGDDLVKMRQGPADSSITVT